jgi:hypothetical protein
MKTSLRISAFSFAIIASSMSLLLSGCETGDDRTLAAGQACLDSATQSTAAQCATIVQGLTSQESYLIRCSANFVSQGFTGSRVANAVANINTHTGTDATTGLIAYLIFAKLTPTVDEAITNCTASGSKSLLRLATAAKLATTLAIAAGSLATFDPPGASADTQMQTVVNNLIASGPPAQQATDIGNAAVLANSAYCADGSTYQGTQVCTDLQTAISSNSGAQAIGNALLQLLKAAH